MPESALRPGPDWPIRPHLLEVFRSDQSRAGHGGARIDVILWVYESDDWRAVCRLDGYDSSAWMQIMEPIIAKSLHESDEDVEALDVHAVVDELVAPIAERFAAIETRESREAFATALYTRLMMLVCEGWGGEAAG